MLTINIAAQLQAFAMTLLLGVLLGFIFHGYQLLISQLGLRQGLLYVCDLILWALLLWLIFGALLFINEGELRSYVFLALIVGVLLYFKYLSPSCRRPLRWLTGIMVRLLRGLARLVLRLLALLRRATHFLYRRLNPPPPQTDEEEIFQ
ncbi:MAG: spore cortex biosynthesis protein YabQ [Syntrophomonadaceae bacterium]|nr:spore cortex biosynthesis protein YabQ [Syntrophomonadaceae bacterium]